MPSAPTSFSPLAPFRIEPKFTARIWGFRDLRPWFDHVAQDEAVGEAWLTGDDCTIATGPHAGQRLEALFAEAHASLLGPQAPGAASPLLIKVIFAREKLSVQVHPDDAMAQKYGFPRGKTECWYALAAEPGAQVAVGLRPGTDLNQIEKKIKDGTLESSLNVLPVAAGDMIFVDAGTVHAIWPGSILLETQQNCDLTYRMYDYGRPRELHIEKSLEATKLNTKAGKVAAKELDGRTVLVDTEHFRVERVQVAGTISSSALRGGGSSPTLAYLFAASGSARIAGAGFEPVDLPPRGVVAVPAMAPEFTVENLGGLDLMCITPNWPALTA